MKQKNVLSTILIVINFSVQAQTGVNNTPANNKGITPTTFATNNIDVFDVARKGTIADMKALIALNKDTINAVNANGFSPLLLACYRGNIEVAQFLIEKVQQIDFATKEGTALTACVYKGELLLAEKLLKKGANPNIADATGITCLTMAVQVENVDMVKLLLQYKVDKTIKDKLGKTALDYALFTRNTLLINLLK